MAFYIFPALETLQAIRDHVDDPDSQQKLLHMIALTKELHENAKEEAKKHGFFKGVSAKD